LFLKSDDKSNFLYLVDAVSNWFYKSILNACTVQEMIDHKISGLEYLKERSYDRIFFGIKKEIRDWYLNQLSEEELLAIVNPFYLFSNIKIMNSIPVMKMLVERHKEGKLDSKTTKKLIWQTQYKQYPLGSNPYMTAARKLRWFWGEIGGMFRGWDECKKLAELYEYFEKMESKDSCEPYG
jgi:hypothetical protein